MSSSASWDALSTTIREIANTMTNSSDDHRLLKNMLLSLDTFASRWLASVSKSGALALPDNEHPDYITSAIVSKASRDLDLIVTAYMQRLSLTGNSGALSDFQQIIDKTDRMAQAALQPALDSDLLTDLAKPRQATNILTYFNQTTHVRLLPYYPLVLVGVPYSVRDWPLDFCAIPHELGHVAFLTSEYAKQATAGGSVRQRVQTGRAYRGAQYPLRPGGLTVRTNWYDPWLEEMFADIYACTVAGPYAAYHMMNLSRGWSSTDLRANPGSYPPPLLRPYICIETLAEINFHVPDLELEGVIGGLRNAWSNFTGPHSEVELADGTKTPLEDGVRAIRDAVHDILLTFVRDWNQLGSARYWPDRSVWRLAVDEAMPQPVVETAAAQMAKATIPEPLTIEAADKMIGAELDTYATGGKLRRLLDFGGWLDKGPEGGKPHRPT